MRNTSRLALTVLVAGVVEILFFVVLIAQAQPPLPVKPAVKLMSPKATQIAGRDKAMAQEVVGSPQVVVSKVPMVGISVDFASLVQTNDWANEPTAMIVPANSVRKQASVVTNPVRLAFIDVATNLHGPWRRTSAAYPTNGGTVQTNCTNSTGTFFFRAGYQY